MRASLVPTSELITLDLPTLERPRNAISGTLGSGKWAASVAAAMNRDKTLMLKFATGIVKLASWADFSGLANVTNREVSDASLV